MLGSLRGFFHGLPVTRSGVPSRLLDAPCPCRPLSEQTVCPQLWESAFSISQPGLLSWNHQSRAENSEWPSPNSKRRNSVGRAVTLALNWNSYIPQGPFQSLLISDVAYTKTQLKSFQTNASGRGLLTVWIIGHIKIHCSSHGKRLGYSCLLAIPVGKNSYC